MLNSLKLWITALLVFPALDYIWVFCINNHFYFENLDHMDMRSNQFHQLCPLLIPASVVYVLLASALIYFVLPKVEVSGSLLKSFLWGAFLGLIIYGVCDLTNYSLLRRWSLSLTLVDLCWGTFLSGVVSTLLKFVRDFKPKKSKA